MNQYRLLAIACLVAIAIALVALLLNVAVHVMNSAAAPTSGEGTGAAAAQPERHYPSHASRSLTRPAPTRPSRPTAPVPKKVTTTRSPTTPGTSSGRSRTFAVWSKSAKTHRVFECESHWNPTDVSASGKYRGLIQADATFWKSWHGLQFAPRPDLATVTEQLQVAYWAYLKRGWSPWPVCGRR